MVLLLQRALIVGLLAFGGGPFFPALAQAPDPVQDFVGEWDLPGSPISITIKRNHVVFHSRLGQGDIRADNADYFVMSYRSRSMTCSYIMKLYSPNELSVVRAENTDPVECDLGELRRARPSGDLEPGRRRGGGETKAAAAEGERSAPENAPKAAEPAGLVRDCPDCPQVMTLAGGSFLMGSPEEGPQHKVAVKAFGLGRYAVTRKEYAQFVEESGFHAGKGCGVKSGDKVEDRASFSFANTGLPQDDGQPAVCVNWYDALAYVSWLSKKTGKNYRLPSEAERDYAARAGKGGPYASEDVAAGPRAAPAAVKVAEWTQDCWTRSYDAAPADGSAVAAGECGKRVVRSASREAALAAARSSSVGFRVARELTQ